MNKERNILVAPLNWGLGHATRCIPIIKELLNNHFNPILASDGEALSLLIKEFPKLECVELPSYKVSYAKTRAYFNLKLLLDCPRFILISKQERKLVYNLINNYNLTGIISDNRPGVYSDEIPSVYITHQLNVLSGNSSWFTTKFHQLMINKFDQCWVPDTEGKMSLSGHLGRSNQLKVPVKYIEPLSRFKKYECKESIDILVILSGPPPHREILEKIILNELISYNGSVVIVRGVVEKTCVVKEKDNLKIYNYLKSDRLEHYLNCAKLVLCRSGYSSIMDLYKLSKKAFFIPTPGQSEQEYLAKRCEDLNIAPYCTQSEFTIDRIETAKNYQGFSFRNKQNKLNELFSLFESK